MVMSMREKRRSIAESLQGSILPSVIKELNQRSRGLHYGESRATPLLAEISGNGWRHTVDLEKKECSCRQWQISGKPCTHALHFIFSRRANLESYVDEYFSVARFKAAYEGVLMPIRGKAQWPKVDPGFLMLPPKLSRSAGRPRTKRIKNSTEPNPTSRQHQCKRCGQFGHRQKGCKEKEADQDGETIPPAQSTKRKRSKKTETSAPRTPTTQSSQASTSSPMTRQRAAAIASTSTPRCASSRSKKAAASPLEKNK